MSLVPARNGANAPPTRASHLVQEIGRTSTKGHVPTGFAEEVAISESSFRTLHRDVQKQQSAGKKRKREGKGQAEVVYGAGAYKGPWASFQARQIDSDEGEEVEVSADESGEDVVEYEEDALVPVPAKGSTAGTSYEQVSAEKETSVFEGTQQYDYQGRTYMHVPQDLDIDLTSDFDSLSLKCYSPKKLIHTFKPPTGKEAHDRALTALRFFPHSGHLLLSAAADGKVKLWDTYHARELLRSYSGHTKSVVDIDFTPDGTRFLSASYDRQMKVWDTETGACVGRYSTGATPHVVRWHPEDPSGTEFLAGMHDNKIVQFDIRLPSTGSTSGGGSSGDKKNPVQEYDHHLGPVNTITYCDANRRFITTSDDKSLRAWEYGIPVPIKLISDPGMFPMVKSVAHPTKPSVLMQSADNTIKVFNTGEKIRANRKKEFRGHNNAGYAIDMDVSPDGGIVATGDSGGFVVFFDFKTCKMWHKIKASDGAVIATAWHPRESSKVVTGDLNGVIKYWD